MMSLIITIIKLIIVLGVVATIHEFGHFLSAKIFKMKVDEFAIGFGKPIFQKKYKDTMYSLRWIPLGGFCALDGEERESTNENSFAKKTPWKRIIVLLAGAIFNACLAAIIFLSINFSADTYTTKITSISDTSVLLKANIQKNDIITKIGNKRMHIYQDIILFNDTDNQNIQIEFLRDGKQKTTTIYDAISTKGYMGVYFDTNKTDENGDILTYIEMVEPGKPAAKSGIKSKDQIIAINEETTITSEDVISITSKNADKEMEVIVLRDGKQITIKVIPKIEKYIDFGITGVAIEKTTFKYSYFKSINTIKQIANSYIDLFKGKVKVEQLSGIVGIGEVISKAEGFLEFINMLGIISLAIGLANVLPFPPLDGGKIVLVLIEAITKKKVSYKLEAILSYIGFALLILLTIYVTINDIIRIV